MIYMYNDDTNEDKSFVHNSHFVRQKKVCCTMVRFRRKSPAAWFQTQDTLHRASLLYHYIFRKGCLECVCVEGGGRGDWLLSKVRDAYSF